MIPTPRALAEAAMRRQEVLSRQLAKAQTTSGASLLPDVLRRAIVTVSVCHETLRALEAAMESGSKPSSHRFPGSSAEAGGWEQRGRYGFVADSIPNGPSRLRGNGDSARLLRAHLALAVDSAYLAYGDLLCAPNRSSQHAALDSLMDYLTTLEGHTETGPRPHQTHIAEAAQRIRVVLDVRRQNVESSNALYRDFDSFTVEGMAWSYCAALLADALRPETQGTADVRAAVRRVDDLRASLERPAPAAAAATHSFEGRPRLASEGIKR